MLSLFLANSVAGSVVVLEEEEARHAASVVRLQVGERIRVSDGTGEYVDGHVTSVSKSRVEIAVESRFYEEPAELKVVVVQALAKGDSSSTAVELLTEIGVDEILPWSALRSIAKWDEEKKSKGLARWTAIAREACKQSRRIVIPRIGSIHSTLDVIARISAADCAIVLHESGEQPIGNIVIPTKGEVILVVGPEGGIDESELELFRKAGASIAVLGPTVLRSAHAGFIGAGLIVSRRWN